MVVIIISGVDCVVTGRVDYAVFEEVGISRRCFV